MKHLNSPFKFLDSYSKDDYDIFFGRDAEIKGLYEALKGVKLLLLYGLSGTGKSSLIECGLRNQFANTDWFALTIRRNDNLVKSVYESINQNLSNEKLEIDPKSKWYKKGFDYAVQALYYENYQPIYILFDQFEELLILGTASEKEEFFKKLDQLIKSKIPCKVILIMREEFIGQLSDYEKFCKNVLEHRFRLGKMDYHSIIKVISKTLEAFDVRKLLISHDSEQFAKRIVNILPEDKQDIELTHLQVFLNELWERACAVTPPDSLPEMTVDLVRDDDNLLNIMDRFLIRQLDELNGKFGNNVAITILAEMRSERDTKVQVKKTELENKLSGNGITIVPPYSMQDILNDLQRREIIRSSGSKEQIRYEIGHDALVIAVGKNMSSEMFWAKQMDNIFKRFLNLKENEFIPLEDINLLEKLSQIRPYGEDLEKRISDSKHHWELARIQEEELQLEKENQLKQAQNEVKIQEEARIEAVENLKKTRTKVRFWFIVLFLLIVVSTIAVYYFGRNYLENDREISIAIYKAEQKIENLEYDSSLVIISTLIAEKSKAISPFTFTNILKSNKKEVTLNVLLELAYWYVETAQFSNARDVFPLIEQIAGKKNTLNFDSTSRGINQIMEYKNFYKKMEELNLIKFGQLEKKYYPHMIKVKGGIFNSFLCTRDKNNGRVCSVGDQQHPFKVEIQDFWIAQYETSLYQWAVFCQINKDTVQNYSNTKSIYGNYPVTNVTWDLTLEYCTWLTKIFRDRKSKIYLNDSFMFKGRDRDFVLTGNKKGKGFRLPTEVEWEYAARSRGEFHLFGNDQSEADPKMLNYNPEATKNSRDSSLEVSGNLINRKSLVPVDDLPGSKNKLELWHMSGNVSEWCWDTYLKVEDFPKDSVLVDFWGNSKSGNEKILRGGSWKSPLINLEVVSRGNAPKFHKGDFLGFRVARWE